MRTHRRDRRTEVPVVAVVGINFAMLLGPYRPSVRTPGRSNPAVLSL